jgi:hypothetical protein
VAEAEPAGVFRAIGFAIYGCSRRTKRRRSCAIADDSHACDTKGRLLAEGPFERCIVGANSISFRGSSLEAEDHRRRRSDDPPRLPKASP